jgi:osmotically-inducible protein OsmY
MRTSWIRAIVTGGILSVFLSILPTVTAQSSQSGSTAPDNTTVNDRDRTASEPSADQQKENSSDREMSRQIRQSLVKDKSLSTYAQNVKIITQDGKVTLKGPVHSQEEKNAVISKAAAIAGQSNITDEVSVVAENK